MPSKNSSDSVSWGDSDSDYMKNPDESSQKIENKEHSDKIGTNHEKNDVFSDDDDDHHQHHKKDKLSDNDLSKNDNEHESNNNQNEYDIFSDRDDEYNHDRNIQLESDKEIMPKNAQIASDNENHKNNINKSKNKSKDIFSDEESPKPIKRKESYDIFSDRDDEYAHDRNINLDNANEPIQENNYENNKNNNSNNYNSYKNDDNDYNQSSYKEYNNNQNDRNDYQEGEDFFNDNSKRRDYNDRDKNRHDNRSNTFNQSRREHRSNYHQEDREYNTNQPFDRSRDIRNIRDENNFDFLGASLEQIDWKNTEKLSINKDFYKTTSSIKNLSEKDVYSFRKRFQITVKGDFIPKPFISFEDTGFPQSIHCVLNQFDRPTPIQSQSWPVALSGRDLIGIAQTGSGKTLAFLVPGILHAQAQKSLKNDSFSFKNYPNVVVLAPTRELTCQIYEKCLEFDRSDIKFVCAYGGAPRRRQLFDIQNGVDFLIGTPGRILDFLQSKILIFRRVSLFVIDEADRMLDMGFEKQVRRIHLQIPPSKQTLFWSATWPKEVISLSNDFLNNPIQINVGSLNTAAVHTIQQIVNVVDRRDKITELVSFLSRKEHNPSSQTRKDEKALIFVATKKTADYLHQEMVNRDFSHVEVIHGDKQQSERESIIRRFKSGSCSVLVCTDVLQRGIDVPDIDYVINYDFPMQIEEYVHRIGRTGRAGKQGISYTLFTRDDNMHARSLIAVLEEAGQEVPDLLRDLECSEDIAIPRKFPKPWNEREQEERDNYLNPQIPNEFERRNDNRDGDYGRYKSRNDSRYDEDDNGGSGYRRNYNEKGRHQYDDDDDRGNRGGYRRNYNEHGRHHDDENDGNRGGYRRNYNDDLDNNNDYNSGNRYDGNKQREHGRNYGRDNDHNDDRDHYGQRNRRNRDDNDRDNYNRNGNNRSYKYTDYNQNTNKYDSYHDSNIDNRKQNRNYNDWDNNNHNDFNNSQQNNNQNYERNDRNRFNRRNDDMTDNNSSSNNNKVGDLFSYIKSLEEQIKTYKMISSNDQNGRRNTSRYSNDRRNQNYDNRNDDFDRYN